MHLKERYLDMEGRMRRCNIRIVNVPETPGSSTPASVSKLLKEVLKTEEEYLVDQSHRGAKLRASGKPRVILAKMHYYQEWLDIFRRAKASGRLDYRGSTASIFPDYAPSVAQARTTFNEVKQLLRGLEGVRYGLYYPSSFGITHNATEKWFNKSEDAMAYIKTNVLPTTSS